MFSKKNKEGNKEETKRKLV